MALVTSTKWYAGSGGTTASSAIDTTGATFLVWVMCSLDAACGCTDSKSNTWTGLTGDAWGNRKVQIFYAANPTVGTGHTFTPADGNSAFGYCFVAAFSGIATSSPFDQQNHSAGSSTSRAAGSITPTENNELIIAGLCVSSPGSVPTIDGGFTVAEGVDVGIGGGLAYLEQGSAAAVNPTWSWTNSDSSAASIASFKSSGGGGGATWPGYYAPFGWK